MNGNDKLKLRETQMSRFIPVDRQTNYLFLPSVADWLPENHLARFIVKVMSAWICRS